MIKTLLLTSMLAVGMQASAETRTWTKYADKSTFEAEYKSLDGYMMTVIKDGKEEKIDIDTLTNKDLEWILEKNPNTAFRKWSTSDRKVKFYGTFLYSHSKVFFLYRNGEIQMNIPGWFTKEDQAWLKGPAKKISAKNLALEKERIAKEKEAGTYVPFLTKQLKGSTSYIENGKFIKKDSTKTPEHYIFYYGASWCGPCKKAAPSLVAKFKQKIANNDKVELIHISTDRTAARAQTWAAKEKFPWATLLQDDNYNGAKLMYPVTRFPTYMLMTAEGKEVSRDRKKVFEFIDGLK